MPTTIGVSYRLTFVATALNDTWALQSFDGTQAIGIVSADGLQQHVEWTATTTGGLRIAGVESQCFRTFDNFSLTTATTSTLTSGSTEEDFLAAGIKADDYLLLDGTTNAGFFSIKTVTATAIAINRLGASGVFTADSQVPDIISILTPATDLYSYDLENHRFSIAPSVKKFQQLFDGNITSKVDPKSNAYVADTNNDDLEKFSTTSRNEYSLTTDLFTGAGDILTFRVKRDLVAPQSAYRAAEIDIPPSFEHAFKKGVLADLLSLPKYSNSDLLKDQRALYGSALLELFGSEESRNRETNYDKDYLW